MNIEQLSIDDLQAQIQVLQKALETKVQSERKDAINTIRNLVKKYHIVLEDLHFDAEPSAAPVARKVVPKYRDPTTGKTWTGRGITPKWIIDKDRSEFLINTPEVTPDQGELPISD